MRLFVSGALALILLSCGAGTDQAIDSREVSGGDPVVTVSVPTPTQAPPATSDVTPIPEPTATPPEPEPTPSPTVRPSSAPEPSATLAPTPSAAEDPTVTPEPTIEPTPEAASEPTVDDDAETDSETSSAVPTPAPDKTLPPIVDIGPSEALALRTASGLVLAVRGESAAGFEVVTPCYNVATITQGLPLVESVDVLIDPGHGGEETGAVGPNGLKESTVNLRVSELLRDELIARGYSAELTRYADHRVAIQSRTELANALRPRLFISVHHNGGYPEPFPRAATEVFVQLDDPEGQRLGGLIFEEVQAAFAGVDIDWMGNFETHGVAWRQNRRGSDLYGVLRRTPDLVSVLTEAMFISTEAEAELLAKPETLVTEADALATAIVRYFETSDPGSGFIEGIVFQGDLGPGGGTDNCTDPDLG